MLEDNEFENLTDELCLCEKNKMNMAIKIGIGVAAIAIVGSLITFSIIKNKKNRFN